MITPLEIEEKKFGTQLSGYNKNEVDNFLYSIANDLEDFLKKIELKEKEIEVLEDELKKFNRIERNITEALVVAKETSSELVENAKSKAKIIIQESELEASKIIEKANKEIMDSKNKLEEIKKDMRVYKVKMHSLIQSQLELNQSIKVD